MLHVENLTVSVADSPILKGLDLDVGAGEVHAIMGPNGSGKSTFAHALAGRDGYEVGGTVTFDGEDLLEMDPEDRAAAGVFMGFQYPVEIPGVNNMYFLRTALNSVRRTRGDDEIGARDFLQVAQDAMELVGMKEGFLNRSVNAGFSGGEKKRNEILQMAVMQPRLAVLDETDSGLDIDALRVVAAGVNSLRDPERSMIVITHYQRLLDYIKPDFVHVLVDGKIVESGDHTLALHLEDHGYAGFVNHDLDDAPLSGAPRVTPALLASRAAALEQVGSLTLPTSRDEAWRYAPHKTLGRLTFGAAAESDPVPAGVEDQIPQLDGPRLVLVNGVVDHDRSNLDSLPTGVQLVSLADASADTAAGALDRDHDAAEDSFSIINRAFGTGGALLNIDGRPDELIHVVDVVVPGSATNASSTRVVVDLAAGSSATLVETRLGSGDAFGGSNVRTEISLAADASLEHIILQDLPPTQVHLGRVDVTQAAGSKLRARLFNLGSDYGRVAYHVHLAGEGAHADLSGLYFGFGEQTLDQQVTVVHGATNCTSRQSYRGVLDDASTGIWNGGVDVRPGADGTDSEQSNDNLLLSRNADVNAMPRLEILADEVSCQHGATVGELDEEALYYLRSRGIRKEEASRLLIRGFADQVMDDLESDTIRTWITERLGYDDA